jgi:hypothetical protein
MGPREFLLPRLAGSLRVLGSEIEMPILRNGGGMRLVLWSIFFVICNLVGVAVFKAAMTLPFQEALLPRILTVPLVGLTALGATRVLAAISQRDE